MSKTHMLVKIRTSLFTLVRDAADNLTVPIADQVDVAMADINAAINDEHATTVVWVLTIDHRHGTNVNAYRTEDGANRALVEYVNEWWEQENATAGEPRPDDDDVAIEAYFEATGESYLLELTTLGD